MKKINKLLMLALCALTVTGCSTSNDSTSSSISSSVSSSSSSSAEEDPNWTSDQKALLRKFCGGVIPFPTACLDKGVTLTVQKDSSNVEYLEITSDSEEFSIEDYYTTLEKAGWTTIVSCNGDKVQKDKEKNKYVELTKNSSDNKTGYDLIYSWVEKFENTEYDWETEKEVTTVIPAHNIIKCYNDFSTTATTDTAWSEIDVNTMNYVITTTLPFIQLGEKYNVLGEDSNSLSIGDFYTKDLSSEYVEKLKAAGFELQSIVTQNYGAYCLTKKLDGTDTGAKVNAVIYYQNGNNLTFFYEHATPTDVDSWPADEIAKLTSYVIPYFELDTGEKYRVYKKNDTYHIEGNIDGESFYSGDYTDQLAALGLSENPNGYYVDWEETVSVYCTVINDAEYNPVAFSIDVSKTTPTSTLSTSWPTDIINNTVSTVLGITSITCPVYSGPSSSKKIKYTVRGQDFYTSQYEYYYNEIKDYPSLYDLPDDASDDVIAAKAEKLAKNDMGVELSIYDVNFAVYEAYEKLLKQECWYSSYDDNWGTTTYEDPTGTLAVTFTGVSDYDTGIGTTTFLIHAGSGETHTPSLTFEQEEYTFGIGSAETQDNVLNISSNMLTPYMSDLDWSVVNSHNTDVTSQRLVTVNSTVDENDNTIYQVTIDDSVIDDTVYFLTIKITVNGKTYKDTCEITAKTAYDYSDGAALETVKSKMSNAGLTATVVDSRLTATVASSTVDAVKTLVADFIPDGFKADSTTWETCNVLLDDDSEVSGQTINYSISFKYSVTLEFYVYDENSDGNIEIRVVAW